MRQALKNRRANIQATQRQQKSILAAKHFKNWLIHRNDQHIACYFSVGDEFPTQPICEQINKAGKTLYLPILDTKKPGHLIFQAYQDHQEMRDNPFGIAEPLPNTSLQIPNTKLDLVITPLVGFDTQGHRIGMGGGYYDRSFSFLLDSNDNGPRPFLLGLAYEVQRVEMIPAQPWDIPLNGILTEQGIQLF